MLSKMGLDPGFAQKAPDWPRQAWLEFRLALSPAAYAIPLGLLLLALMHTGLGGGTGLWARHWAENCEAFLPIGFGLMSSPLLLVEPDEGVTEMAGSFPLTEVAAFRMAVVVGGGWIAVTLGLWLLSVVWGPVPLLTGVLAALGPGLLLGGIACWAAAASGRVTMGYLAAVGIPVADLVLKLLGAFTRFWPLQFANVFSYRWALAVPAWWEVKVVMAVVGILCYLMAMGRWRRYLIRQT